MNRLWLLLTGVALGLATMWLLDRPASAPPVATVQHADDDDEGGDEGPARIERLGGSTRIVLTPAAVDSAGLALATLASGKVASEVTTTGRVSDTADLITLLGELRAARGTAAASQRVVSAIGARLARLRKLSAGGEITVARELAALEVEHERAVASASTRAAAVDGLEAALLARWGASVAALARADSSLLTPLARGEARLVEFTTSGPPPSVVFASPDDSRAAARPAQVVGPAATALGAAGGASFLAISADQRLRAGMALTVWLPGADGIIEGVILPATAVVWHHGARWFYVADGNTRFTRHALGDAVSVEQGFLLPAAQSPPGKVVVHGAQLLLAEEFRTAIPEEDDD